MKIKVSEWGKTVSLKDASPGPIVFHFRPTEYLVVRPEKLKDWEQLFIKNVGLKPDRKLAREWSGDPHETISGSNEDWDDCDYM